MLAYIEVPIAISFDLCLKRRKLLKVCYKYNVLTSHLVTKSYYTKNKGFLPPPHRSLRIKNVLLLRKKKCFITKHTKTINI